MGLLSDRVWGVSLDAQHDRAVVRGFDQWRAFEFFLAAPVIALTALPILAWSAWFRAPDLGFVVAVAVGGLLAVLMLALAQLFRFRVTISQAGGVLERTWAGIRYARRQFDLASTTFNVWETADWEYWPVKEFCEIRNWRTGSPMKEEAIGTPRAAIPTARFLTAQRERFHG